MSTLYKITMCVELSKRCSSDIYSAMSLLWQKVICVSQYYAIFEYMRVLLASMFLTLRLTGLCVVFCWTVMNAKYMQCFN